MIAVEGTSYEDALVKANNLMITNLWGDGLPVWPATRRACRLDTTRHPLPRTQCSASFRRAAA